MDTDIPPFWAEFDLHTTEQDFVAAFPIAGKLTRKEYTLTVHRPEPADDDGLYHVGGVVKYPDGQVEGAGELLEIVVTKTGPERVFVELYCESAYLLRSYLFRVLERAGHMWPETGIIEWLEGEGEELAKLPEEGRRRERGPNVDTEPKLNHLRQIRREHVVDGRVTIAKTEATKQADIWPKTVKRNDPELWERWDDAEYGI